MVFKNSNPGFSDHEILNGVRNQDKEVLLFLYKTHFVKVRKYVLFNNGTTLDAEDLFQDILIFLFDKVRKDELVLTGTLDSYLYIVMRNMWLNQLRRRKFHVRETKINETIQEAYPDEAPVSLEELVQLEKERVFFKYFKTLGEDCKKVLLLFIQGMSIREVTLEMGYSSEQHTKNRRYRCKVSLFNRIKADPHFKELHNGTGHNQIDQIPRW